ncbi:hypothetical protein CIPAW_11G068200 [Carya illinoinensis]|uniref:Uncharacterized protein n=1 Tax=Carya illinoinensis TaxID=32201 RepID=A0A8T1P4M6_CARIL|nr:hypothetical protein CIPAW_11G068200 [Carya illinoinensis]
MDQINLTKQTTTQGSLSVIGCFDVEEKEHSSLRGIRLENEPGENCDSGSEKENLSAVEISQQEEEHNFRKQLKTEREREDYSTMYRLCIRFFLVRPLCGLRDLDFYICVGDVRETKDREGRVVDEERIVQQTIIYNKTNNKKVLNEPKPTASSHHALAPSHLTLLFRSNHDNVTNSLIK